MRCLAPLLALATAVGSSLCAAPAVLAAPEPAAQGGRMALFPTKAEAEAAAKQFNCKGAHRHGDLWMPCASHAEATSTPSSPMAH